MLVSSPAGTPILSLGQEMAVLEVVKRPSIVTVVELNRCNTFYHVSLSLFFPSSPFHLTPFLLTHL